MFWICRAGKSNWTKVLLDPRNIRAKKIDGSDVNQWIQKNNNKLRKFNLVDMKGRNGHRFGM